MDKEVLTFGGIEIEKKKLLNFQMIKHNLQLVKFFP